MIIKGGSCGGAARIAAHLLNAEQNERAEIVELHGVMAGDLRGALREMETAGRCSRTKRPLYHASINPRAQERMTAAQWAEAVDQLESALGLEGQPRAVVEHVKDGRAHRHIVWLRIDLAKGAAISDSHNFRKHEQVARALERAFGFERVQGAHVERKGRKRPSRTPSHGEMQQAARTGVSPKVAKTLITALWRGTATGEEFAAAVSAAGWTLARGDRRDFVLIDPKGGVHSLARRIDGATAKDIRARMAKTGPASLPGVTEVRSALPRPKMGAVTTPRRSTGRATRFPRTATWQASQRASRRIETGSSDRWLAAGAAIKSQNRPTRSDGRSGFYVTVSRERLDYARPCVQPGVNLNSPPKWTPARIAAVGEFKAQATLIVAPVHSPRAENFDRPARPNAPAAVQQPVESEIGAGGGEAADDGLGAFLAAIAAEVQGRAAAVQEIIAAQFGASIDQARKTLPKEQIAGAVAALKQAMQAAMKAVQEAAAAEIKGRQRAATNLWNRKRFVVVSCPMKPWDWEPKPPSRR